MRNEQAGGGGGGLGEAGDREAPLAWLVWGMRPRGWAWRHKSLSPRGFPGGAVVESLPANAGDTGSSPGLGRSHMPRSN